MTNTHFDPAFTLSLTGWIKNALNIEQLSFTSTTIYIDGDIGRDFFAAIASTKTIKKLYLAHMDFLTSDKMKNTPQGSENKISDNGLCMLAESIGLNKSLKEINITDGGYGTVGISSLTNALLKNKSINKVTASSSSQDIDKAFERMERQLKEEDRNIEFHLQ